MTTDPLALNSTETPAPRQSGFCLLLAVICFVFSLVALPSTDTYAHGGGLDGYGCHHNHKAGGYHCHRGSNAGKHYQSKQQMLQRPSGQLSGQATVTDGDSIRIGKTRIRLHGIDAPERRQTCIAEDQTWRCGDAATQALKDAIGGQPVSCTKRDTDRYGRVVAVCRVGAVNLNAWMVLQGWAVAYRRFSTDYVPDEDAARVAKRGMWRGEFVMPWEWRRRGRVLGK